MFVDTYPKIINRQWNKTFVIIIISYVENDKVGRPRKPGSKRKVIKYVDDEFNDLSDEESSFAGCTSEEEDEEEIIKNQCGSSNVEEKAIECGESDSVFILWFHDIIYS